MPEKTLEDLTQQNVTLTARNQWLENVNNKMLVMIKNAADVLGAYGDSLDALRSALRETQGIYSRLHADITEALNEQSSDPTSSEL